MGRSSLGRGLSGDPGHLRAQGGEQGGLVGVPEAPERAPDASFTSIATSRVPSPKMRDVAAMLKPINATEAIAASKEPACRVVGKRRAIRLTKASELVEKGVAETEFPKAHWRM